jgi:hypothetical protein
MSAVPAPPLASEPVPPGAAGGGNLLGVCIGAALIDLALLFGLLVVASVLIGEASGGDGFSFSLNNAAAALYLGLVLVYYFALAPPGGEDQLAEPSTVALPGRGNLLGGRIAAAPIDPAVPLELFIPLATYQRTRQLPPLWQVCGTEGPHDSPY